MKSRTRYLVITLGLFMAVFLAACTQAPAPTTPPATSATSGGLATLATKDDVIAFMPVGTNILAVSLKNGSQVASVGSALEQAVSTQAIALSFSVDSCAADGSALKVVCVGYNTSKIAVLSVTISGSNITVSAAEYDLQNTTTANFSGGSCLNCGVLTDPGDNRFIVSSGDGYRVVDYSGNVLASYLNATGRDLWTENFAFDPTRDLIISPEYGTSNQYLWVININTNKIYRWNLSMTDSSIPTDPNISTPVSLTADAATVDFNTGVIAISDESQRLLLLINLGKATFDNASGTFSAPAAYVDISGVASRLPGMAAEPTKHLVFLEEEFGNGIGAAKLPASTPPGAPSLGDYVGATMPTPNVTGCASYWSNVGDPHGLALYTDLVNGRPMGLLIDSSKTCLAIIDLEKLLSAPRVTGSNTVDPSYDLVANGVVKFYGFGP